MLVLNKKVTRTPSYETLTFNIGGDKVKRVKLEGRTHLKVPMVMITEGVHNGSHGPIYYPQKELKDTIEDWNHMPIVDNHPSEGQSARNADVLNERKLGVVLNARFKNGKSGADAYLDVDRTNEIDKSIIKALEKGEKVEVSTGLKLIRNKQEGEHNGKKYKFIGVNHKPDHLAVLPDSTGACSVKDGAGLLQVLNKASLPRSFKDRVKRLLNRSKKRLNVENDASFSQVERNINNALAARFGEKGQYWRGWVCDVFEDYVVYRDQSGQMMKLGYEADENGDVTLNSTQPVPVTPVMEYRESKGKAVRNKKGSNSEGSVKTFNKKRRIAALIANGQFEQADRKYLLSLPTPVLKKIKVSKTETEEDEQVSNKSSKKRRTVESVHNKSVKAQIASLPPVLQNLVRNSMRTEARQKKDLVEEILAVNTKKKFTKEFLMEKSVDELEGLAELARVANSASEYDDEPIGRGGARMYGPYSGAAGVTNNEEDEDDDEDEDDEYLEDGPTFNFQNPLGDDDDDRPKKKRSKDKTRR